MLRNASKIILVFSFSRVGNIIRFYNKLWKLRRTISAVISTHFRTPHINTLRSHSKVAGLESGRGRKHRFQGLQSRRGIERIAGRRRGSCLRGLLLGAHGWLTGCSGAPGVGQAPGHSSASIAHVTVTSRRHAHPSSSPPWRHTRYARLTPT